MIGPTRQDIMSAGAQLRRLREEQHITQQGMEKLTADRFGDEARVMAQQVSRIEKGQIDKPPILDLLRMGQVLGLSSDDIAEMYHLWPRSQESRRLDPRLRAAMDLADELPYDERERFLDWVQFAVLQARAERRAAAKSSNMPVVEAPASVPNPPPSSPAAPAIEEPGAPASRRGR